LTVPPIWWRGLAPQVVSGSNGTGMSRCPRGAAATVVVKCRFLTTVGRCVGGARSAAAAGRGTGGRAGRTAGRPGGLPTGHSWRRCTRPGCCRVR
jgi:hypothetical protein